MEKFDRRAEWIWRRRGIGEVGFNTASPRLAEESNRYVYFRHAFTVSGDVTGAEVLVSSDGRCQLFVNGNFVGRGPARCSPALQYMDRYDLTPYLRPGRNVLAALVHSYGRHTAWYELPSWEHLRAFGCGGFFLQGEVVSAQANSLPSTIRLDTNATWRCRESAAWQRDVPAGSLGFVEIYDSRQAPVGWQDLEFDDSDWDAAEVLRTPGRNFAGDVIPFPVMIPSGIPALREELRKPEALVWTAEVRNASLAADVASLFDAEPLTELRHCRIENADAWMRGEDCATITTTADHSVSFVLDFGLTQPGRVVFDLEAPASGVVDFTYSERLYADGRVHMHQGIPGFDVRPAHRVVLREGRQRWEAFELSGFRFLQVTVRQCERPLRIHGIGLRFAAYPVEPRGQFACSDDLLNHIWQVGATTLHHCMLDGFVDCPSREQRQWLDAYVDSLINYAAFGDSLLAANMLRQVAQSQQPDGITMMAAPGDFSVMRFTNIPDFCLYWILAINAYLDYIGDLEIVDELYASVVKAIGWFERHLNSEHLLTDVPHWVFVDWAELDKQGQVCALNAQLVAALRTASRLAQIVEAPRDVARFERLANAVRDAINRLLWDEERGVYADARQNGVLSRRISQQTNAAVMAYQVAPLERWSRIFDAILDEDRLVLTRFGAAQAERIDFDESRHVVLAQPFFMYFLHRALCSAGRHQAMLDNIRRRWGAMIASGDRTFRESWQIIELTSLCHAWAGTPTFDLSAEILGISPLSPGFTRFQVAPHPVDLSWAEGAFPTPFGEIAIQWRAEANQFDLTVSVPVGTTAQVILPVAADRTWGSVEVNEQGYANIEAVLLDAGKYHIVARS